MKLKSRLKLPEKQLPFRKPFRWGDNCGHIYLGQSDSSHCLKEGPANESLNTAFLSGLCRSPEGAESEDVCVVSKHTPRRAAVSKELSWSATYNDNRKMNPWCRVDCNNCPLTSWDLSNGPSYANPGNQDSIIGSVQIESKCFILIDLLCSM